MEGIVTCACGCALSVVFSATGFQVWKLRQRVCHQTN